MVEGKELVVIKDIAAMMEQTMKKNLGVKKVFALRLGRFLVS